MLLKLAMEQEGVTQTALAKRLKYSQPSAVSLLLSGKRNLTLHTIADLCQALGLIPWFALSKPRRRK